MKKITRSALCGKDSLGRVFEPTDTVPQKRNRKVGIFYLTWHLESNGFTSNPGFFEDVLDSYDVETLGSPDSPFFDYKYGSSFYWGMPLFGRYRSNDEWTVRRHIELLTLADIDFLVVDATNSLCYLEEYLVLMKVIDESLKAGIPAPKVTFYTNTDSGTRVRQIYDGIYSKGLYKDTWFTINGKPMIIGNDYEVSPELIDFFHFKNSVWPNAEHDDKKDLYNRNNAFPWIDFGKQHIYTTKDGKESVMSVSTAQNSDPKTACFGENYLRGTFGSHGRSFHDGKPNITKDSYKYGFNFSEQWKIAKKADPDMIHITGWNEWVAGVWRMNKENPVAIYDCLNAEYSRDIEPMKDGYGDAYYQLMIDEIRLYKGIDKDSITLPVRYENPSTAAIQRRTKTPDGLIKDDSLRSVITACEVKKEDGLYVFSAETKNNIDIDDKIGDKMRLYVNTKVPGGFEYCFNMRAVDNQKTAAAKREDGRWKRLCLTDYVIDGKKIELKIPEALFENEDTVYFKWVDSRVPCHNNNDFYLYGSVAPLGGLYYKIKLK